MKRVAQALQSILHRDRSITYPALLRELGVLSDADLAAWKAGRVPCLERVIRMNLTKLSRVQTAVRRLAREMRLVRVPGFRGRRYSKTGHPFIEEEYASLYRPTP